MKNKFILGFITGGIICATATGFAVEYVVTANPFPVAVNGTETAIEGYREWSDEPESIRCKHQDVIISGTGWYVIQPDLPVKRAGERGQIRGSTCRSTACS